MRKLLLAFFLISCFFSSAQNNTITLTDDNLGNSFSQDALLLEDADRKLSLEDVLALPNDAFTSPTDDIPNLDFTTSAWWMKFTVKNESSFSYFILETARPVTNVVEFYEIRGDHVENMFVSGDDFAYEDKVIPHNRNIFPMTMYPGQSKSYVLRLVSDGESLTVPLNISNKMRFFENDATQQFGHGFYYGLMYLVVIIYFFFFILLKDISFVYYIIYVATQALLQLALDGYAYRYFFPEGGYMASHFVLLIAGITVVALLQYVLNFLDLTRFNKKMLTVFRVSQFLVGAAVIMSLIPGKTYELSYPIINGVTLLAITLSVIMIYRLRYKKVEVDIFFALAFTVLIVGAVIFILGNFNIIGDAELAQNALKASSGFEVTILSISMSNKYRKLQKEKEKAQAEALVSLEEKNALMDGLNVKLEAQVKERTAEIERQKEELAEINSEILSSIHYAKRIQTAILPSESDVKRLLPESFIFYRPKDVVSGDFYFVEEAHTSTDKTDLVVFAAVDCTGHGVPGAFMSIVGNNHLTAGLTEPKVNNAADALNFLNQGVVNALRQNKETDQAVRDGMDIALCAFDKATNKLQFSGAKNPLYVVRKGDSAETLGFELNANSSLLESEEGGTFLYELKGDPQPIGAYIGDELKPFTLNQIDLKKGDMIYIFSDGFADQFGGERGKKYKYKSFKKLLLSLAHIPVEEQLAALVKEYDNWKGEFEQIDDVLVMGVRVG